MRKLTLAAMLTCLLSTTGSATAGLPQLCVDPCPGCSYTATDALITLQCATSLCPVSCSTTTTLGPPTTIAPTTTTMPPTGTRACCMTPTSCTTALPEQVCVSPPINGFICPGVFTCPGEPACPCAAPSSRQQSLASTTVATASGTTPTQCVEPCPGCQYRATDALVVLQFAVALDPIDCNTTTTVPPTTSTLTTSTTDTTTLTSGTTTTESVTTTTAAVTTSTQPVTTTTEEVTTTTRPVTTTTEPVTTTTAAVTTTTEPVTTTTVPATTTTAPATTTTMPVTTTTIPVSPVVNFTATIDCAQASTCAVPPCTGSGAGTFSLNTDTMLMSYDISFIDLSATETVSHVHGPAAPGQQAGVQVGLPLGTPKVGEATLTQQQQADMLAELFYVNIHSGNCAGGEIRGQIVRDEAPTTQ